MGTNKDCYSATVPVLGIATESDTLELAQKEIESLIQFHLDSLVEEGEEVPMESFQSFVTKYQTTLPVGARVSYV